MAVTIGDLLAEAHQHLREIAATEPDPSTAASAAAGLAPVGRALEFLYHARPHPDWVLDPRPIAVIELTAACGEAARAWPSRQGRVPDVLGAAADAISARARRLADPQRQALTVALAETARRCADTARRFGPYSRLPQLRDVHTAAAVIERNATRPRAAISDRTALDQLIPGGSAARSWTERLVDAAAELHNAITDPSRDGHVCMAEAVLTINAAHLAASHAATLLPDPDTPAAAAATAWRAARIECRGFDDGTKLHPPANSLIASSAARLGRALQHRLGPPPGVDEPLAFDTRPIVAADRPVLHLVTRLLPGIAAHLAHAARTWAERHQVWAPERQLLSYENRNYAVTSTDRNAPAEHIDLDALRHSLGLAATLSTALANDLGAGSSQPRHGYARRDHAAVANDMHPSQELTVGARSAHDALRRAQALHRRETVLPTPRQQPRPRRR